MAGYIQKGTALLMYDFFYDAFSVSEYITLWPGFEADQSAPPSTKIENS